jgi:membrane associated rhomboid family serine protease
VTLALVTAIVCVYGLELTGDGMGLCYRFGLVPAHPTELALLMSPFLHDPANLAHVGGNVVFLAVFGALVEREIGSLRLAALFAVAAAAGGTLHVVVDPTAVEPLVGASGAIFGVMAVAAMPRPWLLAFVVALGAFNSWLGLSGSADGVSFGAHIGGLATGVAFVAVVVAPVGVSTEAGDHQLALVPSDDSEMALPAE